MWILDEREWINVIGESWNGTKISLEGDTKVTFTFSSYSLHWEMKKKNLKWKFLLGTFKNAVHRNLVNLTVLKFSLIQTKKYNSWPPTFLYSDINSKQILFIKFHLAQKNFLSSNVSMFQIIFSSCWNILIMPLWLLISSTLW